MLNPDMPAQEILLAMGELRRNEISIARSAIRWANTRAESHYLPLLTQLLEVLAWYAACDIVGKITMFNEDGSVAARPRLIQDNGRRAKQAIASYTNSTSA